MNLDRMEFVWYMQRIGIVSLNNIITIAHDRIEATMT